MRGPSIYGSCSAARVMLVLFTVVFFRNESKLQFSVLLRMPGPYVPRTIRAWRSHFWCLSGRILTPNDYTDRFPELFPKSHSGLL